MTFILLLFSFVCVVFAISFFNIVLFVFVFSPSSYSPLLVLLSILCYVIHLFVYYYYVFYICLLTLSFYAFLLVYFFAYFPNNVNKTCPTILGNK